jgi:hypothetical protein
MSYECAALSAIHNGSKGTRDKNCKDAKLGLSVKCV